MTTAIAKIKQSIYALTALMLLTGIIVDHYSSKHEYIEQLKQNARKNPRMEQSRFDTSTLSNGASAETLSRGGEGQKTLTGNRQGHEEIFWLTHHDAETDKFFLYEVVPGASMADCSGLEIITVSAPVVLQKHTEGPVEQAEGFPSIRQAACIEEPSRAMYKFTRLR